MSLILSGDTPKITADSTGVITSGTAVASTSGTSIDFTGIPNWVKRITVMFSGVSTSGTSFKLIQLIHSVSTVVNSGYLSSSSRNSSTAVSQAASTSGFLINSNAASDLLSGSFRLTNISGNTWVYEGALVYAVGVLFAAGGVDIGSVLTGVRITTVNGTDTFNAGSINILLE